MLTKLLTARSGRGSGARRIGLGTRLSSGSVNGSGGLLGVKSRRRSDLPEPQRAAVHDLPAWRADQVSDPWRTAAAGGAREAEGVLPRVFDVRAGWIASLDEADRPDRLESDVTCIAWDGKALAGDRQGDMGGTKLRVRKVRRVVKDGKPYLLGASGSLDNCTQWMDWFEGYAEKPTFDKDESFAGLLIGRREVWHVSKTLHPVRIYEKRIAVGSGRAEALGAMMCGKSAKEAVLIAAKLDTGVGCGVDVVRFK